MTIDNKNVYFEKLVKNIKYRYNYPKNIIFMLNNFKNNIYISISTIACTYTLKVIPSNRLYNTT